MSPEVIDQHFADIHTDEIMSQRADQILCDKPVMKYDEIPWTGY